MSRCSGCDRSIAECDCTECDICHEYVSAHYGTALGPPDETGFRPVVCENCLDARDRAYEGDD
jgi:hypothetical protein